MKKPSRKLEMREWHNETYRQRDDGNFGIQGRKLARLIKMSEIIF